MAKYAVDDNDERPIWQVKGRASYDTHLDADTRGFIDGCNADSPNGYTCTRPAMHYGRHVAHGGDGVMDIWENDLTRPAFTDEVLAELVAIRDATRPRRETAQEKYDALQKAFFDAAEERDAAALELVSVIIHESVPDATVLVLGTNYDDSGTAPYAYQLKTVDGTTIDLADWNDQTYAKLSDDLWPFVGHLYVHDADEEQEVELSPAS